jgi:putative radical SAM enzyme (TIGR03279 family)
VTREAGVVRDVDPAGAAAKAGIRAGDRLLEVNEEPVHDVLDLAWVEADGVDSVLVRRRGRTVELKIDAPGPLGLRFDSSLFDGIRRCKNRCKFCFVDQLPRGLRPSLYLKDDDYRLSLLYGNFVTLTNLLDADVARIVEQHISPLYVSWHAAEPGVRRALFGITRDKAPKRLEQLLAGGIRVHVQIVLCPEVNDADVLEATLEELHAMGRGVQSVGIVPVGRSAAGEAAGTPRPPTHEEARQLLAQVAHWQERARMSRDSRWVWAADEWYLLAGEPLPPEAHYEDMPQLGNGVGIARRFLATLGRSLRGKKDLSGAGAAGARDGRRSSERLVLVTGEAAEPVMATAAGLLRDRRGLLVDVLPVPNWLFAGDVSVTGLLGGAEVAEAILDAPSGSHALVPDVIFEPGGLTLDGLSVEDIANVAPGRTTVVASDGRGFARFIDSGGWRS